MQMLLFALAGFVLVLLAAVLRRTETCCCIKWCE